MGYDSLSPKQKLEVQALRKYGTKDIDPAIPMNKHYLVAIDPGRTAGWAIYRTNGYLHDFGQLAGGVVSVRNFLDQLNPKPWVLLYESFQVRGSGQVVSGDMKATLAMIKAIKEWGHDHHVENIVASSSANLNIAKRTSGLTMSANHSHSHWTSAALHGWQYLSIKKQVNPRIVWPRESE